MSSFHYLSKPFTSLFLLVFSAFLSFQSCKKNEDPSDLDSYYHEGKLYAYGQIILGAPTDTGDLWLKRVDSVQSFDSSSEGSFEIHRKMVGQSQDETSRILITDYHPEKTSTPVIYKHKIVTRQNYGNDSIDIWAELLRPAPSYKYENPRYLYVGRASLGTGQVEARIDLNSRVHISNIDFGDMQNHWSLHYASLNIRSRPYDKHYCAVLSNIPNRMAIQIPSDFDPGLCGATKPVEDVCFSSPALQNCEPKMPSSLEKIANSKSSWDLDVKNAKAFDPQNKSRFKLIGDENTAIIELTIPGQPYDIKFCRGIAGHGRNSRNYQNSNCRLQLDSVKSAETSYCVFELTFENASSFEEKVCNLIIEDTSSGDLAALQILAR